MGTIKLESLVVSGKKVDYYFILEGLSKYFKHTRHLFIQYHDNISDVPESILTIPFVANVVPLVWLTNSRLVVPELDKSFLECLTHVKEAYQQMFPNYPFKGSVEVGRVVENSYSPEYEAAALFSGGLDALTTYVRVKEKRPFLITEYGWHDNDIAPSEVWEADRQHVTSFAEMNGLNNILIESNYGTFINAQVIDQDYQKKLGDTWWHGLHHSLAIISAAIPIAFKLKIGNIYIASSNSPKFKTTCASDPTVDNQIKYASGGVIHDGYELVRQEKIEVVVKYYREQNTSVDIRVCFRNKENCCSCEKCLRTLLGIIAEGGDPREFGFSIKGNISEQIKASLNEEIKFITLVFIKKFYVVIQARMNENRSNVLFPDLLDWFVVYDFLAEKRKSLLKYRVTKFFPILKRKLKTRLSKISGS